MILQGFLPPPRSPSPLPRYYKPEYVPEQLFEVLQIHHLSPSTDRDLVLRKGHTMSSQHLGRARYLLQVPKFQHFLSNPTSGLLVVDGHCKDENDGKISPISVFCASLAAIMAQNPACMVLHFFAGLHCFDDPRDPARGPRGLMRSLICQVLLYPGQSQPQLDWLTEELVDNVAEGETGALCVLFQQLLQCVEGVLDIFCILDSISEFERRHDNWHEDLDVVFDHLSSLHCNLPLGVNFKLLITSAGRSWQLAPKTFESERISLRAGNFLDSEKSGLATETQIRSAIFHDPNEGSSWDYH